MKTIAVLSDTHGNVGAIERIMPVLEGCDLVVHLGDCFTDMSAFRERLKSKLICVRGNCDFSTEEKVKTVDIEGKRLLFTHGDLFGVKGSLTRLSYFAEEKQADAVFFGHTHEAMCERVNGILYVNPGAISRMSACKSFAFVTVSERGVLCNINTAIFQNMSV